MADKPRFVPLKGYIEFPEDEMIARAADFYQEMKRRRTVREFTDRPVPLRVIQDCLRTAGAAPSGANKQPWRFVAVSDPELKRQIRVAAEEEERAFYTRRAADEWLQALEPLGTDAEKPFLETAPYLIVVFAETYTVAPDGQRIKNYYVQESVGISTGFLIAALHHAGLATLTHTPSPMGFLSSVLDRPDNERPFLIIVTGYPTSKAEVPVIQKKSLDEIAVFY